MPIMPTPKRPTVPVSSPVQTTVPNYQSATVDSRYTPSNSILQYIEGLRWEVEFYSQMLDDHDTPQLYDPKQAPAFQQYRLIKEFELRVDSPLEASQEDSRGMTVTGSALVLPGVIPNKYDLFIADAGDGKPALFVIEEATRLTHLKETYYSITYKLYDHLHGPENDRIRNDLAAKTIQTFRYVKDYLFHNESPMVTEESYLARQDMQTRLESLVYLYLQDFYSTDMQTLMVPGQLQRTYDPFVVKAVLDFVDASKHRLLTKVRRHNVDGLRQMRQPSIWEALARLDQSLKMAAFKQAGLVDTAAFRTMPYFSSVFFAGIERAVYPKDANASVDAPFNIERPVSVLNALTPTGPRRGDYSHLAAVGELPGYNYSQDVADSLPYIVPVTVDDYYVFSSKFYDQADGYSSQLERLVDKAIHHEPLDEELLAKITLMAPKWDNLERYYYFPVLFALMKIAIRTN